MKLGMISLGCAKNLIDSELFLGVAKKYNLEITNNIKEANIIVVNTCGFIESAKKEAIDTLLDVTENKKGKIIIAMGCLVERYLSDLRQSIPEVDIYFPIRDYDHIDKLFQKILLTGKSYQMDYQNRVLSTLPHSAYLRISEGCNNHCSYCAIPLIRGSFRSRDFNSLIEEAKYLASRGVKEITLIGQDTTRYGTDQKDNLFLHDLIHQISLIDEIKIIRVLYLYPDEITSELIDEIKNNDKVAKYFDIPIQHASNRILNKMNRRGGKFFLENLFETIRKRINDAIIRTTLIVGFPSETEEDFNILFDFVKKQRFNRLGVFTYSDEEDTKSAQMQPKVPQDVMERRKDQIMSFQNRLSKILNRTFIGKIYIAIVDFYDKENSRYCVRNYAYAPDDVDGYIYIYSEKLDYIHAGDIIEIEITKADSYDLYARLKNKVTN